MHDMYAEEEDDARRLAAQHLLQHAAARNALMRAPGLLTPLMHAFDNRAVDAWRSASVDPAVRRLLMHCCGAPMHSKDASQNPSPCATCA